MKRKLSIPRWQFVLLAIHQSPRSQRYCERLNRIVKGSRSYIRSIVDKLAKSDLVTILPSGRTKTIDLTDKGRRAAESVLKLRSEFPPL
ncbi:MAG: hypothetical protein IIB00_02885 [candidate division Zixibacteria bacterium]|nr:hypothetical protein [candidate division Zixibacteria bacterium]